MSGIIDGRRWLEHRLAHLEAQLATDMPDDDRQVIEAEASEVRQELAASRRRFRRWIIFGGRTTGL
jgi:hypothetical protein